MNINLLPSQTPFSLVDTVLREALINQKAIDEKSNFDHWSFIQGWVKEGKLNLYFESDGQPNSVTKINRIEIKFNAPDYFYFDEAGTDSYTTQRGSIYARKDELIQLLEDLGATPEPEGKQSINDKRKQALKFWMAGKGYKDGALVDESKKEVWAELQKIDSKLFYGIGGDFFKNNRHINFKSGRRPE